MSDERIASIAVTSEQHRSADGDGFVEEICHTLKETEQAVLGFAGIQATSDQARSWDVARQIVQDFRPTPWVIWRLSNYVLGTQGEIKKIPDGMALGLRKILLAAGGDPVIGKGEKVSDTHLALKVLKPDVVASVSVIHAVCRRLSSKPLDRIWRPILDDAIVRAQIGFKVGMGLPEFGCGRAMLAGFAGRCGLAILIGAGNQEQAQNALEKLAAGEETTTVGMKIYGCSPLQVSAMVLSASGCGRDAAFGTVSYAMSKPGCVLDNAVQAQWLAAFTITEHLRTGKINLIDEDSWEFLNFRDPEPRDELAKFSKQVARRGHGWAWIL